jgi:hypothetical protein
MINTIRSMSKTQKLAVIDVIALAMCFAFLVGYIVKMFSQDPAPTWQQVIDVMPSSVKQDIAIDFCISHKRMCRSLPLSSPINPKD